MKRTIRYTVDFSEIVKEYGEYAYELPYIADCETDICVVHFDTDEWTREYQEYVNDGYETHDYPHALWCAIDFANKMDHGEDDEIIVYNIHK